MGAALLGRAPTSRAMQPFTSLDELLTVPGMTAAWLDALAADPKLRSKYGDPFASCQTFSD
jgi:hypothetical protein